MSSIYNEMNISKEFGNLNQKISVQLLDYQKIIQSSENPSSKISSDEFFLSISKSLTEDLQELSSLFLESEKSISKVLSVKAEEIRQLGDKCDSLICNVQYAKGMATSQVVIPDNV